MRTAEWTQLAQRSAQRRCTPHLVPYHPRQTALRRSVENDARWRRRSVQTKDVVCALLHCTVVESITNGRIGLPEIGFCDGTYIGGLCTVVMLYAVEGSVIGA